MNRRDFLNNAGTALGVGVVVQTLESCTKNEATPTQPSPSGLTIDLSSPANSALKTTGGFILTKGIYIICTAPSTYIALSSICTHQGCTVNFSSTNNQFNCPCHGGRFDVAGKVLQGPPSSPLPIYSVVVDGTNLTVS
jgi:cytochrome b6-f complex iron-sulfur subunit